MFSNRCYYCLSRDIKVPALRKGSQKFSTGKLIHGEKLQVAALASLSGFCCMSVSPQFGNVSVSVIICSFTRKFHPRGHSVLARAFFIRTPTDYHNGAWPVNFCWASALFSGASFLLLFVLIRKSHLRGHSSLSGTHQTPQLTASMTVP